MSLLGALVDVRPLRASANFRRLWISTSASTFGQQVAVVAVLAQAWELTGSSFAVGAVGLAQAIGMCVCGMVGGSLADAVDRRRLVVLTTLGQTCAAALLAVQAVAGVRSFALILALVTVQGALTGLGAPARRTFAAKLLPGEQLSAGLALSSLSFQVALLVGPALGGLITAAAGAGGAYALDAACLLVAAYGVGRLPAMRPDGGERPGLRSIVSGVRFVATNPVLGGSFLTDVLATVLAMPVALFPAIAAERFDGDPRMIGGSCRPSPWADWPRGWLRAPSRGCAGSARCRWPDRSRGVWRWPASAWSTRCGWRSGAWRSREPGTSWRWSRAGRRLSWRRRTRTGAG